MKARSLLKIIKTRRSIRKFRPYKIKNKEIKLILEAAQWAPSARNTQPWSFIVVKDKNKIKEISKASKTFGTYKPEEMKNSSCIILVLKEKKANEINLGFAIENLVLMAHSLKLGSCIIGAFEKQKIAKLFNIPKDKELCYIIPIGKPAEKPKKQRKPLKDIAFLEDYGKKINF